MHVDVILEGAVMALASGRIAYSLTQDEIFRRLREWIWLRSAPEAAAIRLVDQDEGSWTATPAAMWHRLPSGPVANIGDVDRRYGFQPELPPRDPGFAGQVFECVYCMTFWTSLLAAAAWLLGGETVVALATPFAMWAAANLYAVKGL